MALPSFGAAARTMWYLPTPICADLAARIRDALVSVGIAWEVSDVERSRPCLRSAIRMSHPDKAAGREDPHSTLVVCSRGSIRLQISLS